MSAAESRSIVGTARAIAEELLFPSGLATDAAEIVPEENLDALTEAGLDGIAGPACAGGSRPISRPSAKRSRSWRARAS
jgi:alkylation response protein AidB-like acyl-CoA dehydrogenase